MIKIEETKEVVVKDSQGNLIRQNDTIVFRDKSDRDNTGVFLVFDKGMLLVKNVTNNTKHRVRASSIVYIRTNGGQEVAKDE